MHHRLRATLGAGVAAAALAVGAAPSAAAIKAFHTPSNNIACVGSTGTAPGATYLRCDITSHTWKPPAKPSTCDFDWGSSLGLLRTGPMRFLCVSDAIPRGRVLAYGKTWTLGPFRCTSRTTGLTCVNAARKGFRVSKQRLVRI